MDVPDTDSALRPISNTASIINSVLLRTPLKSVSVLDEEQSENVPVIHTDHILTASSVAGASSVRESSFGINSVGANSVGIRKVGGSSERPDESRPNVDNAVKECTPQEELLMNADLQIPTGDTIVDRDLPLTGERSRDMTVDKGLPSTDMREGGEIGEIEKSAEREPPDSSLVTCWFKDGQYICHTCKFRISFSDSFRYHLWKHLHKIDKSCPSCPIDTHEIQPFDITCPTINEVMSNLSPRVEKFNRRMEKRRARNRLHMAELKNISEPQMSPESVNLAVLPVFSVEPSLSECRRSSLAISTSTSNLTTSMTSVTSLINGSVVSPNILPASTCASVASTAQITGASELTSVHSVSTLKEETASTPASSKGDKISPKQYRIRPIYMDTNKTTSGTRLSPISLGEEQYTVSTDKWCLPAPVGDEVKTLCRSTSESMSVELCSEPSIGVTSSAELVSVGQDKDVSPALTLHHRAEKDIPTINPAITALAVSPKMEGPLLKAATTISPEFVASQLLASGTAAMFDSPNKSIDRQSSPCILTSVTTTSSASYRDLGEFSKKCLTASPGRASPPPRAPAASPGQTSPIPAHTSSPGQASLIPALTSLPGRESTSLVPMISPGRASPPSRSPTGSSGQASSARAPTVSSGQASSARAPTVSSGQASSASAPTVSSGQASSARAPTASSSCVPTASSDLASSARELTVSSDLASTAREPTASSDLASTARALAVASSVRALTASCDEASSARALTASCDQASSALAPTSSPNRASPARGRTASPGAAIDTAQLQVDHLTKLENSNGFYYVCGKVNCTYTTSMDGSFIHHNFMKHGFDRKFPCVYCQSILISGDQLAEHMKGHSDEAEEFNLYKCCQCKFETFSEANFAEHYKLSHSNQNIFTCKHCHCLFSDFTELLLHLKENLVNLKHCAYCHVKSPNSRLIKQHIGSFHMGQAKRFTTSKIMLCKQMRNISNKLSCKCSACGEVKDSLQDMKNHLLACEKYSKSNRKRSRFSCQDCEAKFPNQLDHIRHEIRGHKSVSFLVCPDCSFSTSRPAKLHSHGLEIHRVNTNGKISIYACSTCNVKSTHKKFLKTHITGSHPDRPKTSIIMESTVSELALSYCRLCELYFSSDSAADCHKGEHDKLGNEKPETCHLCTKKFDGLANLSKHILKHHSTSGRTSLELTACIYCAVRSTNKHLILDHIQLAHPEQPVVTDAIEKILEPSNIVCPACPFKCTLKELNTVLTAHIDSKHTTFAVKFKNQAQSQYGEKHRVCEPLTDQEVLFRCQNCTFTGSVEEFRKHMVTHFSGERTFMWYNCGYCNFQSRTAAIVMRHSKHCHKGRTPCCDKRTVNLIGRMDEIITNTDKQPEAESTVRSASSPNRPSNRSIPSPSGSGNRNIPNSSVQTTPLVSVAAAIERFQCDHCSCGFDTDTAFNKHICPVDTLSKNVVKVKHEAIDKLTYDAVDCPVLPKAEPECPSMTLLIVENTATSNADGDDNDAGGADKDVDGDCKDSVGADIVTVRDSKDTGGDDNDAGSADNDAGSADKDVGSADKDAGYCDNDEGSVGNDADVGDYEANGVDNDADGDDNDVEGALSDTDCVLDAESTRSASITSEGSVCTLACPVNDCDFTTGKKRGLKLHMTKTHGKKSTKLLGQSSNNSRLSNRAGLVKKLQKSNTSQQNEKASKKTADISPVRSLRPTSVSTRDASNTLSNDLQQSENTADGVTDEIIDVDARPSPRRVARKSTAGGKNNFEKEKNTVEVQTVANVTFENAFSPFPSTFYLYRNDSNPSYECRLCPQFTRVGEGKDPWKLLFRHICEVHLKLNRYWCSACGFTRSNKPAVLNHCSDTHNSTKPFFVKCFMTKCKDELVSKVKQYRANKKEYIKMNSPKKLQKIHLPDSDDSEFARRSKKSPVRTSDKSTSGDGNVESASAGSVKSASGDGSVKSASVAGSVKSAAGAGSVQLVSGAGGMVDSIEYDHPVREYIKDVAHKRYRCCHCNTDFSSEAVANHHCISKHHSLVPNPLSLIQQTIKYSKKTVYACRAGCYVSERSAKDVLDHYGVCHRSLNLCECNYCGDETSKTFSDICTHNNVKHMCRLIEIVKPEMSDRLPLPQRQDDGRFKCPECHFIKSSEFLVKNHIKNKHISHGKFQCFYCYFGCADRQEAVGHLKERHCKDVPAVIVDKREDGTNPDRNVTAVGNSGKREAASPGADRATKRVRVGKEMSSPAGDGVSTESGSDVQSSPAYARRSSHETLKCPKCDYRSNVLKEMKKHVMVHMNYQPYQCESCPRYSYSESSILKHCKVHHKGEASFRKVFKPAQEKVLKQLLGRAKNLGSSLSESAPSNSGRTRTGAATEREKSPSSDMETSSSKNLSSSFKRISPRAVRPASAALGKPPSPAADRTAGHVTDRAADPVPGRAFGPVPDTSSTDPGRRSNDSNTNSVSVINKSCVPNTAKSAYMWDQKSMVTYLCTLCDYRCENSYNLVEKHYTQKHPGKQIRALSIPKDVRALYEPIIVKENNRNQDLECRVCHYHCQLHTEFRLHWFDHVVDRFLCGICNNYRSNDKQEILAHNRLLHKGQTPQLEKLEGDSVKPPVIAVESCIAEPPKPSRVLGNKEPTLSVSTSTNKEPIPSVNTEKSERRRPSTSTASDVTSSKSNNNKGSRLKLSEGGIKYWTRKDGLLACSKCQYTDLEFVALMKHYTRRHKPRYECTTCAYKARFESDVSRHCRNSSECQEYQKIDENTGKPVSAAHHDDDDDDDDDFDVDQVSPRVARPSRKRKRVTSPSRLNHGSSGSELDDSDADLDFNPRQKNKPDDWSRYSRSTAVQRAAVRSPSRGMNTVARGLDSSPSGASVQSVAVQSPARKIKIEPGLTIKLEPGISPAVARVRNHQVLVNHVTSDVIRINESNLTYQCFHCSENLDTESELSLHTRRHIKMLQHLPGKLNFDDEKGLLTAKQLYQNHGHPYFCSKCGKSFFNMAQAKKHCTTGHRGPSKIICLMFKDGKPMEERRFMSFEEFAIDETYIDYNPAPLDDNDPELRGEVCPDICSYQPSVFLEKFEKLKSPKRDLILKINAIKSWK